MKYQGDIMEYEYRDDVTYKRNPDDQNIWINFQTMVEMKFKGFHGFTGIIPIIMTQIINGLTKIKLWANLHVNTLVLCWIKSAFDEFDNSG